MVHSRTGGGGGDQEVRPRPEWMLQDVQKETQQQERGNKEEQEQWHQSEEGESSGPQGAVRVCGPAL